MSYTNSKSRYGTVAKLFHWTAAILVFAVIPLGLIASRAPIGSETEIARVFTLFSLHKTIGVAIFFVALARIVWAISQPKPAGLHPERRLETFAAETVHWLLYGSLVLAPLSGWIHHAALDGFAPIWWPLGQNLPFIPKDEAIAHLFGNVHWAFTKIMAASILLHVAGALKHHIIDKDVTLRRMWFGKSNIPDLMKHSSPMSAPVLAVVIFAGVGYVASTWHAQTAAPLAAVNSEWTVQEGVISIGVTQFGNDISGAFSDWTAQISFSPDNGPQYGNVTTTIAIGSLTLGTLSAQAMGQDFFDVANFPTAIFKAVIIEGTETDYVAEGTLTIKDISVPVRLPFVLSLEDDVATMSGNLTVNRRDFSVAQDTDDGTLAPNVLIQITLTAQRS